MTLSSRLLRSGGLACGLVLICFLLTTSVALAHERRHVGPYTFIVGFLNEPAYAQQQNSLDLTICKGSECTYTTGQQSGMSGMSTSAGPTLANPVVGAEKTLTFEVRFGSARPLSVPLQARWGQPGKYVAYFMPSRPGTYTFHIFGTLEGLKIDETFTSGPNTFSDVKVIPTYPEQASSGTNASTERGADQLNALESRAMLATGLSVAGTLLGLSGLLCALMAWRRPGASANASQVGATTPALEERLRG
uniref:Uncharacterized protein n=1 Tax=Thermogemmatispora argillosa TaxID=2045280 RepID=A0A455T3C1_9CHLR|nr:hypothetical protein KTA_11740 [Thermogemmatispora argillosa]